MKNHVIACWGFAALLVSPAVSQQQTLARLGRENRVDVPHYEVDNPASVRPRESPTLNARTARTSNAGRAAAQALFASSNLQRAQVLTERALRRDREDVEALFVRMELAAIEADSATTLDAAVRLCEAGEFSPGDLRVQLAATRIRELAANTPEFRRAVPRLRALLNNSPGRWPALHTALLDAAMDGVPGLDPYTVARAAGILTDWRVVGPLGLHTLPQPQDPLISANDDLAQKSYQGHAVENFQFPDGWVRLPDYFVHRGLLYAAARFASLTTSTWTMNVASAAPLEMYVDGQRVHWAETTRGHHIGTLELAPGPHRVMVEFAAAAAPLRVAFTKAQEEARTPLPAGVSLAEATYLLAAGHYSDEDFNAAIRQIDAVGPASRSAALQFLRAQSLTRQAYAPDGAMAWQMLHDQFPDALAATEAVSQLALAQNDFANAVRYANGVLARYSSNSRALEILTQVLPHEPGADAEDLWARRLVAHPSCSALRGAVTFYAARGFVAERNTAQQKLDGCAPESLDYARSLSQDGKHAAAARALEQMLSAAPLNRDARLMLVRELQMSGDDGSAQRAAAAWLRIAPNATNYHRLATAVSPEEGAETGANDDRFYRPYQRDAAAISRLTTAGFDAESAGVLLDDHIAIARVDGSVSLYVHTAMRLVSREAIAHSAFTGIPQDARILTLRLLHPDGTTLEIDRTPQARANYASLLTAGDIVDAEYILHFAGDGGIPEHAEAFQFVFGSFDEPVLNARFIALTPAERADGGVVITTGDPPHMTATVRDGMLERVWEKRVAEPESAGAASGRGIVRVVEQENGWAVPSNAERQRRIETIHRGPRLQDS